jgi:hypothetical protein
MAPLFNPERVDKLKAWCQSYIDSEKYAGILAAVNCDGTDILRESFGHFDRDLKTPVDRKSTRLNSSHEGSVG